MLLNCLLSIFICKTHLPPSEDVDAILEQYMVQFQSKPPLLKPVNLENLLDRLSLGPADLKAEQSTATVSHLSSFSPSHNSKNPQKAKKKVGSVSKQKCRNKRKSL